MRSAQVIFPSWPPCHENALQCNTPKLPTSRSPALVRQVFWRCGTSCGCTGLQPLGRAELLALPTTKQRKQPFTRGGMHEAPPLADCRQAPRKAGDAKKKSKTKMNKK